MTKFLKVIIFVGLVSCLFFGGYFLGKNSSDNGNSQSPSSSSETRNTSQNYEKQSSESTENFTEQSEVSSLEEESSTDEDELILERVSEFLKVFDNCSTKNFEEEMKKVYPIMTEEAQENVVPYYKEDTNMSSIQSRYIGAKHYVGTIENDKATVVSLAFIQKSFNGDVPYMNRTIVYTTLQKVDHEWLISGRQIYVVNDQFPKIMFDEK